MNRSIMGLAVTALALAGACDKKPPNAAAETKGAPGAPAPTAAPAPAPTPAPAPATAPVVAEPAERPGGPTKDACAKAAEHLGGFVVESSVPANAPADQRTYVEGLVKQDRPNVVRFCLETATKEEIDCVNASADFPALAACERFRRQVPKDLVDKKEVTAADCDKFFERLREFKIADGIPGDRVDKDKDQIVRTCLEQAKPGTIACFIASRTYEEARRCP